MRNDGLFMESRPTGGNSRNTTFICLAILMSLALHVIFYKSMENRSFGILAPIVEAAGRVIKPRRAPVRLTPPPVPADARLADPLAGGAGGAEPGDKAVILDDSLDKTPASIFEPPPMNPPAFGAESLAPPKLDEPDAALPRQEIMAIADAVARSEHAPFPRREIPKVERQNIAPDVTASYNLLEGLSQSEAGKGNLLSALNRETLKKGNLPREELPRDTMADPGPVDLGPGSDAEDVVDIAVEIPQEVAPAYPIEDRLRVSARSLVKPGDDYRYIEIDVARKDELALPLLPRDIVLVQDTSSSLGSRYFPPCRAAMIEQIGKLNISDRFEVVAFSDVPSLCFSEFRTPTPENKAAAIDFVKGLKSTGNTDIFASMAKVLELGRDSRRPVIVILFTDGFANAGQISKASSIIGTFTRLNGGSVSVFTVGVQKNANTYLLDMLSYCNRGGGTVVVKDFYEIGKTIDGVIASLGRPALSNVRFNFDQASSAEVFPKMTTNLYEDRPLKLFARVPKDRESMAFQVRGDSGDKKYDMLFEIDLKDGGMGRADPDLDKRWALQRIYDLVAEHARTGDDSLVSSMREIGARYGVAVPFAGRIE